MRRIVVFNRVTADGYFAGVDGNLDRVVPDAELDKAAGRELRASTRCCSREAEAMKSESGKDMIVFGIGSIVSTLTEHGLVDEYQLVVGPLLLGSGRPTISGGSKSTRLKLLEAKEYRSGNVMLRYARPT